MDDTPDLAALVLDWTGPNEDAADRFVSAALHQGGVWSDPRVSDGLGTLRVLEQGPTRAQLIGQIWNIDQELFTFGVVLVSDQHVPWALHFDVIPVRSSDRQNAVWLLDDLHDRGWRWTIRGEAELRGGALELIAVASVEHLDDEAGL